MRQARISDHRFGDQSLTDVTIGEVGRFAVPANLLEQRPVFRSALDVVSISVSPEPGCYTLAARYSVVTTELLAADVRIQIIPKVGLRGLHMLLQWSSHPTVEVSKQALPSEFEAEVGVHDFLVRRFLSSMEGVERHGWLPAVEATEMVSADISGQVDATRSYERIVRDWDLRFDQIRNRMHFDCDPNRILRTTLRCVAGLGPRIDPQLLRACQASLASIPCVTGYSDTREALAVCESILELRTLDGSRAYYYRCLEAARPILQAAAQIQGGNIEYEAIPLRISMPATFESAMRNVISVTLRNTHHVAKGGGEALYPFSRPVDFGPTLRPDIVVRPLGEPSQCEAVFDAKYKDRPDASDHYQLAAYATAYGPKLSGFLTLTDSMDQEGPRCQAVLRDGTETVEYAIPAPDLKTGVQRFTAWLRERVAS